MEATLARKHTDSRQGSVQKTKRQITPFSILPRAYEQDLDSKYGITLGNLKNGHDAGFKGDLGNNVSFNGGYEHSLHIIQEKILDRFIDVPGFCVMTIGTDEELQEHVQKIHELSYSHYVFGKESNMKGQFPNSCCGKSAKNLLLILMEKGYPNAVFLYNSKRDHAYNELPFLFGDNHEEGFIVVDPTSDQLFDDKKNAPRNLLFVIKGNEWDYRTNWKRGENLYPAQSDRSTFSNLHTLREYPDTFIYEQGGTNKYFEKVFDNPVEVSTASF